MFRLDCVFGINVRFACLIILLAAGTQGGEIEGEKAEVPHVTDIGSTTARSTYTCPEGSEAVSVKNCLVGCKRGEQVDNFPHDQRSRFDGCNTCSTHVYRYPDGSTCEGYEICTLKACLPITTILHHPGPQKAHMHDDE